MLQKRPLCFADYLDSMVSKITVISRQSQTGTINGWLEDLPIESTASANEFHAKLFPLSLKKVPNLDASYDGTLTFALAVTLAFTLAQNFQCIAGYNALLCPAGLLKFLTGF